MAEMLDKSYQAQETAASVKTAVSTANNRFWRFIGAIGML